MKSLPEVVTNAEAKKVRKATAAAAVAVATAVAVAAPTLATIPAINQLQLTIA
ncbi:MAG: hypothetical protein WKF97_13840 [Chitinophagaceae bacterium]